MNEFPFELPTTPTRIWDLVVPIIVDKDTRESTAFITHPVDEPHLYNELCYLLDTAKEGDKFTIVINTPGGIIDSAFMIANSIENSKAMVVGRLSGTVASAGTLISMACDSLEVTPHLSFMIHNYSGGMQGKGHEMKARQKFTDDHLNTAFSSFYSGFLSEKEMGEVIDGQDMWMSTDEVDRRWNNRVNYLEGVTDE